MDKLKMLSALMFVMANPAMSTSFGNGITAQKSVTNKFDGGNMLKVILMGIVTLVVVAQLGVAIVPASVTGLSNTSAITGYSTWSTGAQSTWGAIPGIVVLVFFLFFILILVAIVNAM